MKETTDTVPSAAVTSWRSTGLTIKAALVIGFGLTCGLWLFSGYQFAHRLQDLQRQSSEISRRYMRTQELLSNVRAQVLLASVHVRDALLDPDPQTVDEYRGRLEGTYRAVDAALDEYVPVLNDANERERVARLRREIDAFRAVMNQALGSDLGGPAEARLVLRQLIAPKRELVIRVSEDVQALNRSAFIQQQNGIAEIYRSGQQRAWQQFGLVLAASLAIALLATLYASRLEGRIRLQAARDAHSRTELARLSAKVFRTQEEERRHIARELHDEVGQVLTTIKVELAVAQRAIDVGGAFPDVLDDVRSVTDGALRTVRELSHLLHPALLEDLGLHAAVDSLTSGFSRRHGIRVELVALGMDERLTPEVETAAYRIVQAALTNVGKHARATACRVQLKRLPGILVVTVEDDGVGFDPVRIEADARGLGLIGIRERVTELRGKFHVRSAPGEGACLTAELPAEARGPAAPPSDELGVPAPAERQVVNG